MERNCDSCGKAYVAKRATSKYCSDTCRVRKSRGLKSPAAADVDVPAVPDDRRWAVTQAVAAELDAAGRLDTAAGQLAVALARRVDSPIETGAAVASLAKQLDAALATAMRGARVAADPLDELRLRREQKLNAG